MRKKRITKKEQKNFLIIKNYYKTHGRKSVLAGILSLLLLACNLPSMGKLKGYVPTKIMSASADTNMAIKPYTQEQVDIMNALITFESVNSTLLFADVYKDYWGHNAILKATYAGMLNGYLEKSFTSNGIRYERDVYTFHPLAYVENSIFLKALFKTLNLEFTTQQLNIQKLQNATERQYIDTLVAEKIISKDEAIQFIDHQWDYLTRQDVAVKISKAVDNFYNGVIPTSPIVFEDQEQIAPEFKNDVQKVAVLGLMNANEEGNFRPNDKMTRAELATVCVTLNEMITGKKLPMPTENLVYSNWEIDYESSSTTLFECDNVTRRLDTTCLDMLHPTYLPLTGEEEWSVPRPYMPKEGEMRMVNGVFIDERRPILYNEKGELIRIIETMPEKSSDGETMYRWKENPVAKIFYNYESRHVVGKVNELGEVIPYNKVDEELIIEKEIVSIVKELNLNLGVSTAIKTEGLAN